MLEIPAKYEKFILSKLFNASGDNLFIQKECKNYL